MIAESFPTFSNPSPLLQVIKKLASPSLNLKTSFIYCISDLSCAKNIFVSELEKDEIPDITETPYQNYDDVDADQKIGELVNGSDNPKQSA